MKKIITLLGLFICITTQAQIRQTSIKYELTRTNGLELVGGDLVIGNQISCPLKEVNKQLLFESLNPSTIFININNRGGGNSCVTLVVETQNGNTRIEIPENSNLGIRQFLRVKSAFLKIEKTLSDTSITELKSIGEATIWL